MEWWDFAGTFHKNHKSGTNVYTNEVGASPAKNGIMWNGCLWQTLGIFGVSKVYTLTIPKVHASLDLSWSGGGVPNENDAGPQSLQNNTLTIHYTAHLFRHCAQACYNYSGQNEITVTCWHPESWTWDTAWCSLGIELSINRIMKSSRRCVLTVLCADFLRRPMQAAATSRYLAICQHAEETIVHKPNQIKLIWSLEILFNPKHLKNATLRRIMFLLWLIGIGTISKLQQQLFQSFHQQGRAQLATHWVWRWTGREIFQKGNAYLIQALASLDLLLKPCDNVINDASAARRTTTWTWNFRLNFIAFKENSKQLYDLFRFGRFSDILILISRYNLLLENCRKLFDKIPRSVDLILIRHVLIDSYFKVAGSQGADWHRQLWLYAAIHSEGQHGRILYV